MPHLASYLAQFDFSAVPLTRAATGHLRLETAAINGRPVTLYLDTGAGRTVIDLAVARTFELALVEDARGAGGAGATQMKNYRTQLASLQLGPLTEKDFSAHVIDLSHVNQALRARSEQPMEGVVGADVLDAGEAVIDYRQLRLYLKRLVRPRAVAA